MPRHAHATLSMVTTGHSRSQNGVLRTPMPVVHADLPRASAGGLRCACSASAWIAGSFKWKTVLCTFCPAMTNGKNGKNEKNERKNIGGETPTDAIGIQPRLTGPAAPPSGGAHLSAFHRGSGLGDRTPPPSFSSALPGMRPPSGFPLSLPVSVQRCFSRTGRNAGRADFPKLPGSGLQGRARVPHSPRGCGLPAAARPIGRGFEAIGN